MTTSKVDLKVIADILAVTHAMPSWKACELDGLAVCMLSEVLHKCLSAEYQTPLDS
jgi:hypothetical protein